MRGVFIRFCKKFVIPNIIYYKIIGLLYSDSKARCFKNTKAKIEMEANNMQNEKKELLKKFKTVIDDLMDHYEEYTEEEKMRIKEIFLKVAELNTILDKYDIEVKFDWKEYFALLGEIDIPIGG
jgi:hypothetical protein